MQELNKRLERILRWSERYIKTDMVYLAHGSFWFTLGRLATVVTGFALSIFFANYVSSEVYGNYRYILSVAGIVAAFSLTGMNIAITQAVAKGFEGALKRGFDVSLRWGVGMTAISWVGSLYYFLHSNSTLGYSLFIIGLFQPIFNSVNLYGSFLNGKKDFKRGNLYLSIKSFFVTGAIIATLFFTHNPIFIILSYFVSNLLVATLFYIRTISIYKPNESLDPDTVRYSKHLSAMSILGVVASQIDKVIVFQFLGATELAIYAFAILMPEQVREIFRNFSALALPKFSEKENLGEIRKTILSKSLYFLALLTLATFFYIVLAPIVFEYVFPKYMSSVLYSQVFALSLLSTVAIFPLTALRSQQKEKRLYILNISTAFIQILLLIPFAYFYGLWGVIVARIISKYSEVVISYLLLRE